MPNYYILNHYTEHKLAGVWVSQGDDPPESVYFDEQFKEIGESVVLPKRLEQSWDSWMDQIAQRMPTADGWWVGDTLEAPTPPDASAVADLMQAEDERLHNR